MVTDYCYRGVMTHLHQDGGGNENCHHTISPLPSCLSRPVDLHLGVRKTFSDELSENQFSPLSSAADQDFHGGETQALRPHFNFNVLLSLFYWGLHQINDSPEAFL